MAADIPRNCWLDDDVPCPSPCVFDDPRKIVENCTFAVMLQHAHKGKTDCPHYKDAAPAPVVGDELTAAEKRWIDLNPDYIDPEHAGADRKLLAVFYAASQDEGGSADEMTLRGLRAVLARFGTAPPPPAEGEVGAPTDKEIDTLWWKAIEAPDVVLAVGTHGFRWAVRQALARWGSRGLDRCHRLQQEQRRFREPERTILCDILANGTLLPDPDGSRYGGTTPAPVPVPWCWLSEQRPAVGQLCQAAVLGRAWLEAIEGRWHEQQDPIASGFSHACGLFVSDPGRTLWRPLPEEMP